MLICSAAAAGELSLSLSGTSLGGGPAFEATLGAVVVGSGVVEPLPPPGEGTEFLFTVSDDLLRSGAALEVRLTNDAYEEGVGDRNLQIISARIGDTDVAAGQFELYRREAEIPRSDGLLNTNADRAVATAPPGGWLQVPAGADPLAGVEPALPAVPLAEPPVEAEDEPVAEAPEPAVTGPSEAPACDSEVVGTGFAGSSAVLSSEQQQALLAALTGVSADRCNVEVTGYSDVSGPVEVNKQMAEERAAAVAEFLGNEGISFADVEVVGFGETEEFGETAPPNRRVIVKLSPAL
jgi:outer membrane protein OmpA-like peptidoglycan-associated protein